MPSPWRIGCLILVAMLLGTVFPPLTDTVAAQDFEEEAIRLGEMAAGEMDGEKSASPGSAIVLDYVDMTGSDGESRLGGGSGGLGRHLRNLLTGGIHRAGLTAVDPGALDDALRRIRFTVDDVYNEGRVIELMRQFPNVESIFSGIILPADGAMSYTVETTWRRLLGDALVPTVNVTDIMADANAGGVMGITFPPLSDNRPNTVLAGHPFLDTEAPYRIEIRGRDGMREFRYRNGRIYVAGDAGDQFSIRIANNSGGRVAASVFVDGLPVNKPLLASRDMEDKANILPVNAEKIIVNAGRSVELSGWIRDGETSRPFVFADTADAENRGREYWQALGMITVAFYPAEGEGSRAIWDISRDGNRWFMKEIPGGGGKSVSARAKGDEGGMISIRHSPIPSAILTVNYGSSSRVRSYSLVKE